MAPLPLSRTSMTKTLIVDPGAHSIKAGFAQDDAQCRVIPNCIARSRDKQTYVGSDLSRCTDYGEMVFRRPAEKGYIVNWDAERLIWEREFFDSDAPLKCDPHETNLLLAEPPNALRALQSNTDQILFEEFEFAAVYRTLGPALNAYSPVSALFNDNSTSNSTCPVEAVLVVDLGHSHTTITPLLHGRPIQSAIKRQSIGGKHLTHYLAELISLRHFSLIDEPWICEQIKHDACFVSSDFNTDLDASRMNYKSPTQQTSRRNEIVVDYVLPDFETLHKGYMRPHDASHAAKLARLGIPSATKVNLDDPLDDTTATNNEESFPLANERFAVPELLFTPTDIGLRESGLPETIMQSLSSVPRALWTPLLSNIVLVGGTSLLPGLRERVEDRVRMLAPSECIVRVARASDPITATWKGGANLAIHHTDSLRNTMISRDEYLEHGENWVMKQFATRKLDL